MVYTAKLFVEKDVRRAHSRALSRIARGPRATRGAASARPTPAPRAVYFTLLLYLRRHLSRSADLQLYGKRYDLMPGLRCPARCASPSLLLALAVPHLLFAACRGARTRPDVCPLWACGGGTGTKYSNKSTAYPTPIISDNLTRRPYHHIIRLSKY